MTEREHSLAEEVLSDPKRWLSDPSPTGLRGFLDGASFRGETTMLRVAKDAINGPLDTDSFWQVLFGTSLPRRSPIGPFHAVEIVFAGPPEELLPILQETLAQWRHRYPRTNEDECSKEDAALITPRGDDERRHREVELWWSILQRLEMYFGEDRGQHLQTMFAGMKRGGDWLGYPTMFYLDSIVDVIEAYSDIEYGDPFIAYKRCSAQELLHRTLEHILPVR